MNTDSSLDNIREQSEFCSEHLHNTLAESKACKRSAVTDSGKAPRLKMRLAAFSNLLRTNRLASHPSGITVNDLYNLNKLLLEVSNGLLDEANLL